MGRGAWPSAHAKPRADLSAEEAATSVLAAVSSAAQSLGQTPVSGQLSAAQVLADPPSRQAAARWRSGDAARRVTAALAKVSQLLQEWVVPHSPPTGAPAVAQPQPVRPANHRDTARADNVAGAAVRWLPSLPRLRVDWRLLLLLTVVLLFPRVVALSVALVVRLVLRAVGNLFASLVKELYTQALLTSAELESQLVDWLQEQMGMAPPAVPAQLPPPGGAPDGCSATSVFPPDPPSRVGHHRPPSLQPTSACTGWRGWRRTTAATMRVAFLPASSSLQMGRLLRASRCSTLSGNDDSLFS